MVFRGGLRFGSSYPDSSLAPWPLGKLIIEQEFLQLSVPWRKFHFPREHVSRILQTPGMRGIWLRVEHHVLEEPNVMVFWTHEFPAVKEGLAASGYPVPFA